MPAATYVVEQCHNPSCDKEIRRQQWQIKRGAAKFCSRKCVVLPEATEAQLENLLIARSPCKEGCSCKKHFQTEEHKLKNSIANTGRTSPMKGKKHSLETRERMSKTTKQQYLDGSVRAYMYPKAHFYNGLRMRSESEILCAKLLDGSNIEWLYEPKRFDLGWCTYLPDFYLPEFDIWIEVKGYMSDRSLAQINDFRAIYRKTLVVASWQEVRCGS